MVEVLRQPVDTRRAFRVGAGIDRLDQGAAKAGSIFQQWRWNR